MEDSGKRSRRGSGEDVPGRCAGRGCVGLEGKRAADVGGKAPGTPGRAGLSNSQEAVGGVAGGVAGGGDGDGDGDADARPWTIG